MTPEKLAEYDKIQKGFADRVIKMIEEESAHRREIEKLHLEDMRTDRAAQRELAKRGQTFGLLIGLATIIAGSITAGTGHELAGGIHRRRRRHRIGRRLCRRATEAVQV